jgi:hypothetical protein
LQTLDIVTSGAVEEAPRSDPPSSPALGAAYIVDSSATGAWVGKPQCVAAFTSGGWRFVVPIEGMTFYVKSAGAWANYRLGSWEVGIVRGSSVVIGGQQVLGSRAAAIASASGGTTIDMQARSTIDQILGALRQHGLIDT